MSKEKEGRRRPALLREGRLTIHVKDQVLTHDAVGRNGMRVEISIILVMSDRDSGCDGREKGLLGRICSVRSCSLFLPHALHCHYCSALFLYYTHAKPMRPISAL